MGSYEWMCPLADLILQLNETASQGISSLRTDPPMGLLTHLQSHSCDVMEPGVGKSASAICEYKNMIVVLRSELPFFLSCEVFARCE